MRLMRAASIDIILRWYALPLFVMVNMALGFALGHALLLLLGSSRVPRHQRGIVVAVTAIGECISAYLVSVCDR